MHKRILGRVLSVILSVTMVFTSVDMSVLAAEAEYAVEDTVDVLAGEENNTEIIDEQQPEEKEEVETGKEEKTPEEDSEKSSDGDEFEINETEDDTTPEELETEEETEEVQLETMMDGEESGVVASGECGAEGDNVTYKITWNEDNTTQTLTLEGTGAMVDCAGESKRLFKNYENDITNVVISEGITTIGSYAFYNMKHVKTMVIPDGVTTIKTFSFANWNDLSDIFFPDSVENVEANAFYILSPTRTMRGYTEGTFPKSVQYSGNSCLTTYCVYESSFEEFEYWSGLDTENISELVIPEGICSVPYSEFYNSGIKKVTFPSSINKIYYRAFAYSDIEELVISSSNDLGISREAFSNCTKLSKVQINNSGDVDISSYAFNVCTGLESVYAKGKLTLNSDAFYGCSTLEDVTLVGLNDVKTNVFRACTALKNLYIRGNRVVVSDGAFSEMANLEKVTLINLDSIGNNAFLNDTKLKEADIEFVQFYDFVVEDIKGEIGEYAFKGCSSLQTLKMKGEVRYFRKGAFADCTSLESIFFPEFTTDIEEDVCKNDANLKLIYFPSSLKRVCTGYGSTYTSMMLGCHPNLLICWRAASNTSIQVNNGWSPDYNRISENEKAPLVYDIGEAIAEKTLPYRDFGENFTMPAGQTVIPRAAFYGRYNIRNVVVPEGVTKIEKEAFYNCRNLQAIYIPETVTSIDDNAIQGDRNRLGDIKVYGKAGSAAQTFADNHSKFKFVVANSITCDITLDAANNEIDHDVVSVGLNGVIENFDSYVPTYLGYDFDGWYTQRSGGTQITAATRFDADTTIYAHWNKHRYTISFSDGENLLEETQTICNGDQYSSVYSKFPQVYKQFFTFDGWYTQAQNGTKIQSNMYFNQYEDITLYARWKANEWGNNVLYDYVPNDDFKNDGRSTQSYTLVFDGKGEMLATSSYSYPWRSRTGSDITRIEIGEGITSIPDWIFYNGSSIRTVKLPNTVTSIGKFAFCSDYSLENIVLPDELESIGEAAFEECEALGSITLPEKITKLEDRVFCQCINLSTINTKGTLTELGELSLSGTAITEFTLPNGMTSVPDSLFDNCSKLERVELPSSINTIKSGAFSYCTSLTTVSSLANVVTIEDYAFSGCVKLKSFKFPESLKVIGVCAFSNCDQWTEVKIPAAVETLGEDAFNDCDNLVSIYIPKGVRLVQRNNSFEGNQQNRYIDSVYGPMFSVKDVNTRIFLGEEEENCSWFDKFVIGKREYPYSSSQSYVNVAYFGVTEADYEGWKNHESAYTPVEENTPNKYVIKVPEGTSVIPNDIFANNDTFSIVNIPYGIARIGNRAFSYSKGITAVDISDTVTIIGKEAFSGCVQLESVYIPKSVTKIAASEVTASPFWNASEECVIYCEFAEDKIPEGFGPYWNYTNTNKKLKVVYGVSRETYEADLFFDGGSLDGENIKAFFEDGKLLLSRLWKKDNRSIYITSEGIFVEDPTSENGRTEILAGSDQLVLTGNISNNNGFDNHIIYEENAKDVTLVLDNVNIKWTLSDTWMTPFVEAHDNLPIRISGEVAITVLNGLRKEYCDTLGVFAAKTIQMDGDGCLKTKVMNGLNSVFTCDSFVTDENTAIEFVHNGGHFAEGFNTIIINTSQDFCYIDAANDYEPTYAFDSGNETSVVSINAKNIISRHDYDEQYVKEFVAIMGSLTLNASEDVVLDNINLLYGDANISADNNVMLGAAGSGCQLISIDYYNWLNTNYYSRGTLNREAGVYDTIISAGKNVRLVKEGPLTYTSNPDVSLMCDAKITATEGNVYVNSSYDDGYNINKLTYGLLEINALGGSIKIGDRDNKAFCQGVIRYTNNDEYYGKILVNNGNAVILKAQKDVDLYVNSKGSYSSTPAFYENTYVESMAGNVVIDTGYFSQYGNLTIKAAENIDYRAYYSPHLMGDFSAEAENGYINIEDTETASYSPEFSYNISLIAKEDINVNLKSGLSKGDKAYIKSANGDFICNSKKDSYSNALIGAKEVTIDANGKVELTSSENGIIMRIGATKFIVSAGDDIVMKSRSKSTPSGFASTFNVESKNGAITYEAGMMALYTGDIKFVAAGDIDIISYADAPAIQANLQIKTPKDISIRHNLVNNPMIMIASHKKLDLEGNNIYLEYCCGSSGISGDQSLDNIVAHETLQMVNNYEQFKDLDIYVAPMTFSAKNFIYKNGNIYYEVVGDECTQRTLKSIRNGIDKVALYGDSEDNACVFAMDGDNALVPGADYSYDIKTQGYKLVCEIGAPEQISKDRDVYYILGKPVVTNFSEKLVNTTIEGDAVNNITAAMAQRENLKKKFVYVKNASGVVKLAQLLSSKENVNLSEMSELEERYAEDLELDLDNLLNVDDTFGQLGVSKATSHAIGLGLNSYLDEETEAKVVYSASIKPSDTSVKFDTTNYSKCQQFDVKLNVANEVSDESTLFAPIIVSMPVPNTVVADNTLKLFRIVEQTDAVALEEYPFNLVESEGNATIVNFGFVEDSTFVFVNEIEDEQSEVKYVLNTNAPEGTSVEKMVPRFITKSVDGKMGVMPTPGVGVFYEFAGWFTAADGGEEVTAETVVSGQEGEVELFAHWNRVAYKVVFDSNYDSADSFEVVRRVNQPIGHLSSVVRNYYNFIGWFTEPVGGEQINESTVVASDITYYAHWDGKEYTVSFNTGYDSTCEIKSKIVKQGEPFGKLPIPTYMDSSKAFGGWYYGSDTFVTEDTIFTKGYDLNLYPKWGKKTTINLYANGGKFPDGVASSFDIVAGSKIGELPVPIAPSKYETFDGWYTYSSGGTKVTKDTVYSDSDYYTQLYAHWKVDGCVVRFSTYGLVDIIGETEKLIKPGDPIGKLPVAKKEGYKFKCWTEAPAGYGTITVTPETILPIASYMSSYTLYAVMEPIDPVTWTVDYNNGSNSVARLVGPKGVIFKGDDFIRMNSYKEGCVYAGIYTQPEGGECLEDGRHAFDINRTVYIHWIPDTHMFVELDTDGGECEQTVFDVTFGEPYGAFPTPTREGYKFLGWYSHSKEGYVAETDIVSWEIGSYFTADWEVDTEVTQDQALEFKEALTGKTDDNTNPSNQDKIKAKEEFITELLDSNDKVEEVQDLEERYSKDLAIEVKEPEVTADAEAVGVTANSIVVVGAALNVDVEAAENAKEQNDKIEVQVVVDVPTKEIEESLAEKIENAVQLDIKLEIDGEEVTGDLDVPIMITMLVPDGVDLDDSLVLIHEHNGVKTVLDYRLDMETRTVTFAVTGFSNFIFANKKDGVEIESDQPEGGETTDPEQPGGGETTDTEQPGGGETTDPEQPGGGETTDPEQPGGGETTDPEQPGGGEITDPEQPGGGEATDPVNPGGGEITDPTNPDPEPEPEPVIDYGEVDPADVPEGKPGQTVEDRIPTDLWIAGVEDKTYTGKAITQNVRVYAGKKLLTNKTDYTITYNNNINAGKATIKVVCKGNYVGTKDDFSFNILPKNLAETTVSRVYSVSAPKTNKSAVILKSVKNGSTTLKASGKDYTVSYYKADEKAEGGLGESVSLKDIPAGEYRMVIDGVGNYTGRLIFGFTVAAEGIYPMSSAKVTLSSKSVTFGGTTPYVKSIKIGGKTYTETTDEKLSDLFKVEYADADHKDEVGVHEIIIMSKNDKCAGATGVSYTVAGKAITKNMIAVSGNYTYTGNPVEAILSTDLRKNVDYKVTYSSNTKAGTAKATVVGIGEYKGTLNLKYTIAKASMDNTLVTVNGSSMFSLAGAKLNATIMLGAKTLKEGTDYTVTYANNKAIGKARATIKGKGNMVGTKTVEFDVVAAPINADMISVGDVVYKNTVKNYMPAVTVKQDGKSLKKGTDYIVSYLDNGAISETEMAKGYQELTVTVSAVEGKPFVGSASKTFIVYASSRKASSLTATINPKYYTGKEITLSPGDITVKDATGNEIPKEDITIVAYKNNIKVGSKAEVSLKVKGYGGLKTVKFTINPKDTVIYEKNGQ